MTCLGCIEIKLPSTLLIMGLAGILSACEGQMPQMSGPPGQKINQAVGMGQRIGEVDRGAEAAVVL